MNNKTLEEKEGEEEVEGKRKEERRRRKKWLPFYPPSPHGKKKRREKLFYQTFSRHCGGAGKEIMLPRQGETNTADYKSNLSPSLPPYHVSAERGDPRSSLPPAFIVSLFLFFFFLWPHTHTFLPIRPMPPGVDRCDFLPQKESTKEKTGEGEKWGRWEVEEEEERRKENMMGPIRAEGKEGRKEREKWSGRGRAGK